MTWARHKSNYFQYIFLTIINFSGHFANVIKTGQEPKNSELGLAHLTAGVDKKSAKSNIEILTEEQEGDCQEEEEYYDDDFEGFRIFQPLTFHPHDSKIHDWKVHGKKVWG